MSDAIEKRASTELSAIDRLERDAGARGLRTAVPDGAIFVDLEVPFHDVDPLFVAWHGHYSKYLEIARTALQRHHQLDVADIRALGFAWFVIETRTRHVQALHYGERFRVFSWFVEDDPRVGIAYEIRSLATIDGAPTGHRVARARTVLVNTVLRRGDKAPRGELLFATPRAIKERIGLRR